MKVPALDMQAHLREVGGAIKAAVAEVIDSGQFILGERVAELERRIAAYVGADFGVGVSSGTDALLVALMSLDVGAGDLVITTPYTFFATAGTIARLGATPVFVDIDATTYNMDPEALEAWLAENPDKVDRVKAIVPVHLFGQCADMEAILALAQDRGLPVLEDAAQAIGASCAAGKAGSLGALATFSFFPSKNLGGIGDGGMVVTSDDRLAEKLRVLRVHGSKPKYYHRLVGGNFRLDAIQAAALLVKLDYLDRWHQARRERAAHYDAGLEGSAVKTPVVVVEPGQHIYNQYVIEVPGDRDGVRDRLAERGVATAIYYPVPLHLQECFADLGYKLGDLPRSEHAAAHSLALPIYPELTREMQDYVISAVRDLVG